MYASRELEELKRIAFAKLMQSVIRGYFSRQAVAKLRKATIIAQTRWRGKVARRIYTQMRIEARYAITLDIQSNSIDLFKTLLIKRTK